MKIKLNDKERAELFKMWRSGELDTDKIKSLKEAIPEISPMTVDEAKRIIADL